MLNEEEMDWDLPTDREIGSVLCGERAVTDSVSGHTFQASPLSAIMISESVKKKERNESKMGQMD